jgi:ABC-type amino acid transport substrate-binding protein
MKNESNTGNSTKAIRKSCNFVLGAALLSTLLFASAAHAQSYCVYSRTNDGRIAATCMPTNNSGTVSLAVSGTWQPVAYYKIVDGTWINIYYYGPKVWTTQNRITGQIWVANAAGGWTMYQDYAAQALSLLKTLTTLAQSQTPSAPTITIVPKNFTDEYCSTIRAAQQYYAKLGYPIVPVAMCGQ